MVPRSVLNDLRRQAASELAERRIESKQARRSRNRMRWMQMRSASRGRAVPDDAPTQLVPSPSGRTHAELDRPRPHPRPARRGPRLGRRPPISRGPPRSTATSRTSAATRTPCRARSAAGMPVGLATAPHPEARRGRLPVARRAGRARHRARPQSRLDRLLPRAPAARPARRRLQPERRERTDRRPAHPRGARAARAELRPELGAVRVAGPPLATRVVRDRSFTSTCRCSTWSTACSRRSSSPARTTATAAGRATGTRSSCATASGRTSRCCPTPAAATPCSTAVPQSGAEYVGRMRELGAADVPRRSAAGDAGPGRAAAGPLRASDRRAGRRARDVAAVAGAEPVGRDAGNASDAVGCLAATSASLPVAITLMRLVSGKARTRCRKYTYTGIIGFPQDHVFRHNVHPFDFQAGIGDVRGWRSTRTGGLPPSCSRLAPNDAQH